MKDENYLKSLLIRSSLSDLDVAFYFYVKNNPWRSVSDAVDFLDCGKSSVYRSYEKLKNLGLVESSGGWKSSLKTKNLNGLIRELENEKRKTGRLVTVLKAQEKSAETGLGKFPGMEVLNSDETFERYIDLSKQNWAHMMAYGNWEDFNKILDIVRLEKQFIRNRIQSGGKAFVAVTKEGPSTKQIIDFNREVDRSENRKSKFVEADDSKPFWINTFESTNYVHIWYLNSMNKIESTFVESEPIASHYKRFLAEHVY